MKIKDSLGNRMKWYEGLYADQLMKLNPVCARLDGRAFHSFTRGLSRPFDQQFIDLMIATTKYLVESTGATIGYVQSDEISLVWYEENFDSQVFFDGNHSKMVSILASKTSTFFNKKLPEYLPEKAKQYSLRDDSPEFDARVFSVPTLNEATNYLIWREKDATRNSVTMAAQAYYSHNQLHCVSTARKHDLLHAKGVNWNDYPSCFKRGTYVQRVMIERPFTSEEIANLPPQHEARKNPKLVVRRQKVVVRELPPLTKIVNRVDVIFLGAEPVFRQETAA